MVDNPTVSVIIPTWSGKIDRLRASLEIQTFQDFELVVVTRVSPAGRARNQGVDQARGDLLVFIDDDAYLGHERVLATLIDRARADAGLGVVGSSKLIPPDAPPTQRRIGTEVPRWEYPVVAEDTESNPPLDAYGYTGITTTCCVVPRHVFEEVNGFDENLTTGPEDTEFFYRIRQRGYRFLIPADCYVFHPPPGSLRALVRKSFGYGIGHGLEARKTPQRNMDILRLRRWYGKVFLVIAPLFFVPMLFVNVYFEPRPHLEFGFRPYKAVSTFATMYGYAWGWFRGAR